MIRKCVMASIIVCYRSVVRHPFLVGMILFMFSMYRFFPFLFSLLLSASPVLVSTAVLLGTLLSFGHPNIPEIEKEPESEIRSKTETVGTRVEVADRSFVEGDDNLFVQAVNLLQKTEKDDDEKVVLGSRYSPLQQSEDEHEHIVLESDKLWEGSADPLNSNSGLLWKKGNSNDDDDDDGSDSGSDVAESSSPDASMADIIPMLDELHPLLSEEQETHQLSHISHDGVSQHSLESSDTSSESNDDTGIENHNDLKVGDDEDKELDHTDKEDDTRSAITWTEDDQKNLMNLGTLELERNRRLENLIASRRARDDAGGIENHDDLKMGDDEDEDEESEHIDKEDDTRSAIKWTEDDQKNLLDLGTSELERNRHLENLIAKQRARDDTRGIGNHEILKFGDDEDEDKESEHVDKEDETRSAITWTEDDQKNLMNLGTSEIERNRRLENLIARRRARKTMRMQAENNTMDLESSDLPWNNIPPISTSRNNPFDYDANDNIPGSAPSVFMQRRNPFDLPYDSSEEKPDLVGDTFQQEFAGFQPKEPYFRRHESFNVGPSNFGVSRSERQESKLKPYFVPERSFSTFQRQFSGLSDSKASSVPDTESVSSDLENKDHIEEEEHASEVEEHVSDYVGHGRPYFVPEHVAADETGFPSFQRQLSEVSDSKVAESVSSDLENKDQIEEDEHSGEAEHTFEVDEHVSDHVSHGRPYFVPEHVASDETSFVSFQRQLSEVSGSKVSSESDSESVSSADDLESKDHIDLSQEPDLISLEDHEHTSETVEHVSERVSLVSVESMTNQQELHSNGSSLSSSDEASEQIYNEKEGDEVAAGTVSETDYFLDRGSLIERSEIDVTGLVVDERQPNEPVYDLSPRSVTRNLSSSSISMDLHKDENFQHYDGSETRDTQNLVPAVPEHEEHVDSISRSLPDKPALEAKDVVLDLGASHELEEVQDSSSNSHAISQEDEESLLGRSSDKPLAEDSEELQAHDLKHGEVALPTTEAQFIEVVHGEIYENHSPTHGEDISQLQKEFPLLDTSVNEPSEDNPEVLLVQITSNNQDNLQIQEPDVVEVADIETKAQEIPAYASDTHSIESNIDDVDVIKEIDEDLLVELDAVGDFSVRDFGSTLNEMKEDPHTPEHDLENRGIAEEDSNKNDLESNLSEMKQYPHEHDLEINHSVDEVSYSNNLETTLDERKQDPLVLDHDPETVVSGDEDSYSKDLGSTLDEIKQDSHVSDHDLENSEEMEHDPHALDHDLVTDHSEEMKEDPHASVHDLENKHFENDDSYSKDATLDEMKQNPHDSTDLEIGHSGNEDSYSKNATLEEMKQDPHDLETKHAEDEDSYSKDATLEEMKQDPHASEDMKQDPHASEHKHAEDEDSGSKEATLDEMKHSPHDSSQDLETKHFGDEDSYSKGLGSTLDEMKQDPHETNQSIEEDSYSKDLDTTFSEMKEGPRALEHRLETFYSVDENLYSKHVESAFNEMQQNLHALDEQTNPSGETKAAMDAEVMKSQNENDISNTKVEGTSQAEASGSKLANEVTVLPQETESTTSLANSTSTTMVNHGTENASATSITDKE